MIKKKRGNLLNASKGIIVHGCNAQRVFNSGLAKQIRLKYPEVYASYMKIEEIICGEIYPVIIDDNLIIVNMITQKYYGNDGRKYVNYDNMNVAFTKLNKYIQRTHVSHILNFPKIGCGLGGGDWRIISEIIDCRIADNITKNLWISK